MTDLTPRWADINGNRIDIGSRVAALEPICMLPSPLGTATPTRLRLGDGDGWENLVGPDAGGVVAALHSDGVIEVDWDGVPHPVRLPAAWTTAAATDPTPDARVAGYEVGPDGVKFWRDPGNGQFATPGWSTAKSMAVGLVKGLLARDNAKLNPAVPVLLRPDGNALEGIGVPAGKAVKVRYLNDEFGIVDIKTDRATYPTKIRWDRFADPDPDLDRVSSPIAQPRMPDVPVVEGSEPQRALDQIGGADSFGPLNADLTQVDFSDKSLERVDLSGAKMQSADLAGRSVQHSKLWSVDLTGANLAGAVFDDTILQSATMDRADAKGASFRGTDLAYASMFQTKLVGADFAGARLMAANFYGADLTGARFGNDTDVTGVDFTEAVLNDADLSGITDLSRATLTGAKYNAGTRFPEGFDRTGMVETADGSGPFDTPNVDPAPTPALFDVGSVPTTVAPTTTPAPLTLPLADDAKLWEQRLKDLAPKPGYERVGGDVNATGRFKSVNITGADWREGNQVGMVQGKAYGILDTETGRLVSIKGEDGPSQWRSKAGAETNAMYPSPSWMSVEPTKPIKATGRATPVPETLTEGMGRVTYRKRDYLVDADGNVTTVDGRRVGQAVADKVREAHTKSVTTPAPAAPPATEKTSAARLNVGDTFIPAKLTSIAEERDRLLAEAAQFDADGEATKAESRRNMAATWQKDLDAGLTHNVPTITTKAKDPQYTIASIEKEQTYRNLPQYVVETTTGEKFKISTRQRVLKVEPAAADPAPATPLTPSGAIDGTKATADDFRKIFEADAAAKPTAENGARIFEDADGRPLVNPDTGGFLWPADAASETDPGVPATDFAVVNRSNGWEVVRRDNTPEPDNADAPPAPATPATGGVGPVTYRKKDYVVRPNGNVVTPTGQRVGAAIAAKVRDAAGFKATERVLTDELKSDLADLSANYPKRLTDRDLANNPHLVDVAMGALAFMAGNQTRRGFMDDMAYEFAPPKLDTVTRRMSPAQAKGVLNALRGEIDELAADIDTPDSSKFVPDVTPGGLKISERVSDNSIRFEGAGARTDISHMFTTDNGDVSFRLLNNDAGRSPDPAEMVFVRGYTPTGERSDRKRPVASLRVNGGLDGTPTLYLDHDKSVLTYPRNASGVYDPDEVRRWAIDELNSRGFLDGTDSAPGSRPAVMPLTPQARENLSVDKPWESGEMLVKWDNRTWRVKTDGSVWMNHNDKRVPESSVIADQVRRQAIADANLAQPVDVDVPAADAKKVDDAVAEEVVDAIESDLAAPVQSPPEPEPAPLRKGKFPPTPQQVAVLEAFKTGESLVVKAGAGAGKTSTLVMIAEAAKADGRHGLFTAFNRAIVNDAGGKLPSNVNAATMHAIANRAMRSARPELMKRLNSKALPRDAEAKLLGITDPVKTEERTLRPGWLAGWVMKAVEQFAMSADREPGIDHFEPIRGLSEDQNTAIAQAHLVALQRAWQDLTSDDGKLRFGHSTYLKLFELSNPNLNTSFILFDESQDASPVMASIITQQQQHGTQLVFVGDADQCQPVGTMVTTVAARANRKSPTVYSQVPIEQIAPGDKVLSFDVSKSFLWRDGRPVEEVASRPYDGPLISVSIGDSISEYTPNHRCVVRIGDALQDKWVVYMMRRGTSFRIGMTQGVYDRQGGVVGLPVRMRTEGAEAGWILSAHDSQSKARVAEAMTSWVYGVPSLRFRTHMETGITTDELDQFWAKVGDLTAAATRCLSAHGRELDHPLCIPGKSIYRRRSGLMRACNVMDGMLMLPLSGAMDATGHQITQKRWEPVTVGRRWYSGNVYSLKVSHDETYIADGIMTHNSINGFMGAVDSLSALEQVEGVNSTVLNRSFRFGPEVANVANNVLARFSDARIVGAGKPSTIGTITDPDAILTRTNGTAMGHAIAALDEGKTVAMSENLVKALQGFAKAAKDLQTKGWTDHADLAPFGSWGAVQQYVQDDPAGEDIKTLVDLIDEHGAGELLDILEDVRSPGDADLTVLTAHTSKGLEFPKVLLAEDFPQDFSKMNVDDFRLMYVAATRAQERLDVGANTWILEPPLAAIPARDPEAPPLATVDLTPEPVGQVKVPDIVPLIAPAPGNEGDYAGFARRFPGPLTDRDVEQSPELRAFAKRALHDVVPTMDDPGEFLTDIRDRFPADGDREMSVKQARGVLNSLRRQIAEDPSRYDAPDGWTPPAPTPPDTTPDLVGVNPDAGDPTAPVIPDVPAPTGRGARWTPEQIRAALRRINSSMKSLDIVNGRPVVATTAEDAGGGQARVTRQPGIVDGNGVFHAAGPVESLTMRPRFGGPAGLARWYANQWSGDGVEQFELGKPQQASLDPQEEQPVDSDQEPQHPGGALMLSDRRPGTTAATRAHTAALVTEDGQPFNPREGTPAMLTIDDEPVAVWLEGVTPTISDVTEVVNHQGWQIVTEESSDGGYDNLFSIDPLPPAERCRVAAIAAPGNTGQWLVAKDNYLSRIGVKAGEAVQVKYEDDEHGVIDVDTGEETRAYPVKWDRFDDGTITDSTTLITAPRKSANATKASAGAGSVTEERVRAAGFGHAVVADNYLSRYGIVAGAVVPVTWVDATTAMVAAPTGQTIRAAWSRFADNDPGDVTLDAMDVVSGTEFDRLPIGSRFGVEALGATVQTPEGRVAALVKSSDNGYAIAGEPAVEHEWNATLAPHLRLLVEKER